MKRSFERIIINSYRGWSQHTAYFVKQVTSSANIQQIQCNMQCNSIGTVCVCYTCTHTHIIYIYMCVLYRQHLRNLYTYMLYRQHKLYCFLHRINIKNMGEEASSCDRKRNEGHGRFKNRQIEKEAIRPTLGTLHACSTVESATGPASLVYRIYRTRGHVV